MNCDVKGVSLVVAVLRPRNDDARADDPFGKLFKLLNFFFECAPRLRRNVECRRMRFVRELAW